MDEIERQVQLPPGAQGLEEYARYYSFDGERVTAIYVTSDGNDLHKGQRLWLAERYELPVLLDGGCATVNIVYDPLAQRVEQAYCNGLA